MAAGTGPQAAAAAKSSGGGTMSRMETASVVEYLRSHGYAKALSALQAELEAATKGAPPAKAAEARDSQLGQTNVSMAELASKNVPRDPRDKDAPDAGPSSALERAGAQALLLDPTDTARGYGMIKSWCTGSLDIYQPELLPILLPLFVHSYMNLVDMGLGSAAAELFSVHSSFFQPTHAPLLSLIHI